MNNKCFIICWFGKLPSYLPVWMHTCRYNSNYDFLFFTDQRIDFKYPNNIKFIKLTLKEFQNRASEVLGTYCNIKKAYRVCDFRPMYGVIFKNELVNYNFWGYCDIDIVFGNISSFISDSVLARNEAIFNGGPFTLIRNTEKMNNLYKCHGAAFSYYTVIKHDAIFAFDETTGIQQIANKNGIKALYMVPYIETEIKYKQLRSRLDATNPNYQAFYWEKGELFRTKIEVGKEGTEILYQKYPYMHLQKRKIEMLDSIKYLINSFWITPHGFCKKTYYGKPTREDIVRFNPYEGSKIMKKQSSEYMCNKLFTILRRTPFQIYVRIIQEKNGINKYQGAFKDREWEMY